MAVKRDIDFFEFVRADSEIANRGGKGSAMALPIGLSVLAVLACWMFFSALNIRAGRELTRIGEAFGGVNMAGETSGEGGSSPVGDMLRVELDYNDSALLTQSGIEELISLQPDDLEVLSVSYNGGVFNMSCYSVRELCGADFAGLLRESERFGDVNYTGVAASNGGYSFSLSFSYARKAEHHDPEVEL